MDQVDGILMAGRVSLGWNFHETRAVKTFVLGVAVSFVADRWLITVGPFTLVVLKRYSVRV